MSSYIKWGLIAGGVVALLNLCGGVLIGACNNCLAVLTVLTASAVAGYLCARQEPPDQIVKAGALAGGIVGVISMVSQLIGGVLGGVIGIGLLANFNPKANTDPATFYPGAGLGIGVIILLSIVFGLVLIFAGAGMGALVARNTAPVSPGPANRVVNG